MEAKTTQRKRAPRSTAALNVPFDNLPNDGLVTLPIASAVTGDGRTKLYELFNVQRGRIRVGDIRAALATRRSAA
jgi:hypothetical protein